MERFLVLFLGEVYLKFLTLTVLPGGVFAIIAMLMPSDISEPFSSIQKALFKTGNGLLLLNLVVIVLSLIAIMITRIWSL